MKSRYSLALAIVGISLTLSLSLYASQYSTKNAAKIDKQIETVAHNSFVFENYLKDEDIKIEVKDGVVALNGTTSGEMQSALAQQTLEGIKGVKRVDNFLKIKDESAGATIDQNLRLQERIRDTLLLHSNINNDSIKITDIAVNDGVATIKGMASNQAQKELISEYATDVEGVKSVNNEILVTEKKSKQPGAMVRKIDDTSITAQVKVAMLFHRSTSALKTKIETNKGIVTITGKAKNSAERDLVTKLTSDVNGVRNVKNHMTIE
ncbi:MAG: BON domain-containing protein [Oligoflexia bacterium]|nr:BON domain-containing protein [Oligoflexia bacterium]MBF0366960.1 BON domain-containing protein [Oligoflexia bacterium]